MSLKFQHKLGNVEQLMILVSLNLVLIFLLYLGVRKGGDLHLGFSILEVINLY